MAKAKTYTLHGHTKTIAEWAKQTGMCPQAIRKRLRDGWPIEAALTAKAHTRRRFIPAPVHDELELQLTKTLRRLVREAEQEMVRLSHRLAKSLAFDIDVRALADALHGPGVGENLPNIAQDRPSPVAEDRT
ncbi:hypothetical protein DBT46_005835, partial [Aerococcus mictus]|jgi:hypothetical protein|uniref:hypothetical protein n=1 Tax=Aerococcus mictus TaxID=2976810 RepID=UPI000DCE25DB|nr:hypothetical protein DBT46_12710 [Aerococcus mictus]